ncbi:MAG: hypothetical protein K2W33_04530 [Burkholderiales bacterium]|nr:hypothetical protein [Burkholderiales bacterium]
MSEAICDVKSPHDQAIEILKCTDDGNQLSMEDLALLETVINSGLGALSPRGLQYWNELHEKAVKGEYVLPWLHGQQHLTKDQEGNVFWKGHHIEHYSFKDKAAEAVAAKELARVCLTAESRGLAMTWASCLQIFHEAQFGQGMPSPRFHVYWVFSETGHDLTVIPELSCDHREASAAAKKHSERLAKEWNTPDGALRTLLVVSQEGLDNCRRNIRCDAAWARAVLRSTAQQCQGVEAKLDQQMSAFMGDVALPSQRPLSEFVLAKAADDTADNEKASNSPV